MNSSNHFFSAGLKVTNIEKTDEKLKNKFTIPFKGISLAIAVLANLCGCGLSPSAPDLRETPSTALQMRQETALATSGFTTTDQWPDDKWWCLFGDPQLDALVERALFDNPNISTAEYRILKALANSDKAHAPMFPQIEFDGGIARLHQSQNGVFGILKQTDPRYPITYFQRDIHIQGFYQFDFFKVHRNELLSSVSEYQAICAEYYTARLSVALAVAQSYFRNQISRERVVIGEELTINTDRTVQLLQKKVNNGLDAINSVNSAINNDLSAKQFLYKNRLDMELANNQLQALLAADFLVPVEPVIFTGDLQPFPLPECLPLELISHRADVWAKRWRVEAAARQVCAARGAFYPNINILLLTGFQAIQSNPLLDFGSTYGLIYGPTLSLPIFNGGKLQADLDAAKQDYNMAVAAYDQAVLDAVKEVLDAVENLKYATQIYELAIESERVNRMNYELMKKLLGRTLVSKLSLLNAEVNWLNSKDNYLQALYASLDARLMLIKALGGGFASNCECFEYE